LTILSKLFTLAVGNVDELKTMRVVPQLSSLELKTLKFIDKFKLIISLTQRYYQKKSSYAKCPLPDIISD
jgi:hypothetical protein